MKSAMKTTSSPGNRGRSFASRMLVRLLVLGLLSAIAGAGGLASLFWYYGRDLPTLDSLRQYTPPQTTRVVDRHGHTIAELFTERRTIVPLERLPRVLVLSVLAAEDADFYRHRGLDYPGILRALYRDVVTRAPAQGASTITQQVVKNVLLSPERTLKRKVRELILARRMEQELSKEEILWLYLNTINFGHGRYGVQEASRYYFRKDVEDLTLSEASLLAGIPKAPAHLSPRTHPDAARRRQLFVLDQLENKRAEYWPDLTLATIHEARDNPVVLPELEHNEEQAPEIVEIARRFLRARVGEEAAARGGYVVTTTLDLELQAKARESLRDGLGDLDERRNVLSQLKAPSARRARTPLPAVTLPLRVGRTYDATITGADDDHGIIRLDVGGEAASVTISSLARYNTERKKPSALVQRGARVRASIQSLRDPSVPGDLHEARIELGAEGAIVVVDPRTREVLALVGGYEDSHGFDRATLATRQAGSTFKPIVYALALKSRKFTPASLVLDAPEVFDQWQPRNYETWHYQGSVRLREALAQSINLVAVRVMQDVGPPNVLPFAQALGIHTPLDPQLSLVLGASDVRVVELTNAYATFAAGGHYQDVRYIRRITGPDGAEIPLGEPPKSHVAMTQAEAYLVTSMLSSVVESGTATAARRIGRPAAGKTGTSNDARDAWFVGYTPELACGVWVGYDDRRSLGARESGARTALPIWVDLMKVAEASRPSVQFPRPAGLVTARIDPATGKLAYPGQADAIEEIFLEGTVPVEVATPPDMLDATQFLMQEATQGAVGLAP